MNKKSNKKLSKNSTTDVSSKQKEDTATKLFMDNFDCWAKVPSFSEQIPAMTKEKFIEIVEKLL